jgi:hypothetical protein
MDSTWWIYTSASAAHSKKLVRSVYEALSAIVGEDLAEHLEPGEELEPPVLGYWPDITLSARAIPSTGDHAETASGGTNDSDETVRTRLGRCLSAIQIERPQGFHPALVTAVRLLLAQSESAVFSRNDRHFVTGERLLEELKGSRDLSATLRAVAAGELDADEEFEQDEDDTDHGSRSKADSPEDEDALAAKPEALRQTLIAMADYPRARRRASAMMGDAPALIATFVERLARVGAESDAAAATALQVAEQEIVAARRTLAGILKRAEKP